MNGRAPEYRRCNEVTMVNPETWEFKTFWKNVHQQFLITEGTINGCTYKAGESRLVESKEEGNAEYIECRKAGWLTFREFLKKQNKVFQANWNDFDVLF